MQASQSVRAPQATILGMGNHKNFLNHLQDAILPLNYIMVEKILSKPLFRSF
jgi:hypothetical protein